MLAFTDFFFYQDWFRNECDIYKEFSYNLVIMDEGKEGVFW